MGRVVGDNETSQGSTALQTQETIPHSFPENAPLPSSAPLPISQAPSDNILQSNRPHGEVDQEEEEEEDLYPIHPHDNQRPVSFPPQNNEYDITNHHVHAFPPASMYISQPTPPSSQHGVQMVYPTVAPMAQPNQQFHAFPPASMYVPQPTPPSQHGVQMVYPAVAPMAQPLYVSGVTPDQLHQDKPWNSGLFDCMNDPENALITACFPCITFGQIAEILDHGSTSCATSGMLYSLIACCFAIPCIISCAYRTKLRAKFGLVESPAPDWVVHWCCEWCALCQEYRQLKDMGYDPTIGWSGNEARIRQQLGMTPPMRQIMMM